MNDGAKERIRTCDDYLLARTGHYGFRRIRYAAAATILRQHGLADTHTVLDFGAGWTEFGYHLHAENNWRGRYWPVDGGLDGVDLQTWSPPRQVEWIVALEVLEHLANWKPVLARLLAHATRGVILSTPNPATTDVLGMDPTHVSVIQPEELRGFRFTVQPKSFYGQPNDSLFAWRCIPCTNA